MAKTPHFFAILRHPHFEIPPAYPYLKIRNKQLPWVSPSCRMMSAHECRQHRQACALLSALSHAHSRMVRPYTIMIVVLLQCHCHNLCPLPVLHSI